MKDAKLIAEVYKESRSELGSFNLYMCWDEYVAGRSKEKFYVIDDAGFVRWGYSKKYDCNIIKDIGILKACRGQGYGRILFDAVPKPVLLKCNADNDVGNRFYKMLGMNKTGVAFTKKGRKQFIWTKN